MERQTSQNVHTLTLAGMPVDTNSDDAYSTPVERQTHDALTLALRNMLYQKCYAFSLTNSMNTGASQPPPTLQNPDAYTLEDVTSQLSAANQGTARWDPDWIIEGATAEGQYFAVKNNIRRSVLAGEFINALGFGQPVVEGSSVHIHHPHEATKWQPGFYYAFSNAYDPHFDTAPLVRFYWNVRVGEASFLVSEITAQFNHYQMPFRFKCTNQRSPSERIDTAVLYVSEAHFSLALLLVMDIHQRIDKTLNIEVPMFTYPLARGLAFAQDPPGDNSFGTDRCLRLAVAILHCLYEADKSAADNTGRALSKRVLARLESDGLDLKNPHITRDTNNRLNTQLEEFTHEQQH